MSKNGRKLAKNEQKRGQTGPDGSKLDKARHRGPVPGCWRVYKGMYVGVG